MKDARTGAVGIAIARVGDRRLALDQILADEELGSRIGWCSDEA